MVGYSVIWSGRAPVPYPLLSQIYSAMFHEFCGMVYGSTQTMGVGAKWLANSRCKLLQVLERAE